MSAEGLLDNPALFAPSLTQAEDSYREIDETSATSLNKLDIAMEYLALADKYPVKMKYV
jgi:hypothetical protein